MADVNELNSSLTVKIAGANSSGSETNFADTLPDGSLKTNVTNGSGAAAVNIQDGGNSITVDGTVSVNNITGTVVLPTGASTSALQTTGNTTLTNINNKLTSTNNQLQVQDGFNTFLSGVITGSTAIEAKVGGTALANRKGIFITPDRTVYWGATNAVTTANGTPIFKNQTVFIAAKAAAAIFLISGSGTANYRIVEAT